MFVKKISFVFYNKELNINEKEGLSNIYKLNKFK